VSAVVAKVGESRTGADLTEDAVELIASGRVDLVVNTPRGSGPRADGAHIRRACVRYGVACLTTVSAALAAAAGMEEQHRGDVAVRSLQDYHRDTQLRLEL
jgi:carbamoyl-phosphate synthase large subunit